MNKKILFKRISEKNTYDFRVVSVTMGILMIALLSSHILTEAFAAKPSNGFLNTSNCNNNKQATKMTCCWREATGTYKYPTPTYCQTCDTTPNGGYTNCTDPELQFLIDPDKSGDITNPKDSGGVLSNNDDSSNSGIPKGIDPSTGGTFNDNSESSNQDNSKGIDPNNGGGIFRQ